MADAGMYARNAAAMWESRAPWSRVVPGALPGASVIEIAAQPATRVILRRPFAADPGPIGALMAQANERGRVVVEDSFGTLTRPAGDDIGVDRMPVSPCTPRWDSRPYLRQPCRVKQPLAADRTSSGP